MVGTSLYIIVCAARNRARTRLRRLREPRYLLGALAAVAYLYFSLFRVRGAGNDSSARPSPTPPPEIVAVVAAAGPTVTACLLALAAAAAWLVPVGGGLLEFSRAEIQFLFPAPVDRRWLLVHRLLRSQLGLLFASIVPAIVFATGGVGARVRVAVSMWIVLVTLRVFFTGVSLARPRLNHPDPRARWLARVPVLLTAATSSALALVIAREFVMRPVHQLSDLSDRLQALGREGAASWLLVPFHALARPLFANDWKAYALTVPGSLLIMGLALVWILESDRAFEAAADRAVEGHDRRQSTLTRQRYRLRATPWTLGPRGTVEGALIWKAATETVRLFNARALLSFSLPLVSFMIAGSATAAFPRGFAQLFAAAALLIAGFATAMGPQIVRSDLRRDLVHLDVLKTWPVRPSSLIRGALLWPAMLLTGVTWLGVVAAAILAPRAFPEVTATWRVVGAVSAVTLAPALIIAQLVVHNGVALIFPAWVSLGGHRPRGLDAMGQRLITLAGTWLALALMAAPGGVVASVMWFVLAPWLGPSVLVLAAAVCTIAMLVESTVLTEVLGPAFDRLDLTDVERAE